MLETCEFIKILVALFVLQGGYKMKAVFKDNTNNSIIACVEIKTELKKSGGVGGFLFG